MPQAGRKVAEVMASEAPAVPLRPMDPKRFVGAFVRAVFSNLRQLT